MTAIKFDLINAIKYIQLTHMKKETRKINEDKYRRTLCTKHRDSERDDFVACGFLSRSHRTSPLDSLTSIDQIFTLREK